MKHVLLSTFVVLFVFGFSFAGDKGYKTIGSIHRHNPEINKLIPQDAVIEVLAEDFDWSEGPVWIKDGEYLLFNDIPQNTTYKWSENEGLTIFLRPAGYTLGDNPPGKQLGCNGLFINPTNSQLVLCEHGNRCLSQLNQKNWTKSIIVDKFEGKRLNSPNDVVISSTGHIYFTDPPYGLTPVDGDLDKAPQKELDFNGVFHLSPDGTMELVTKELPRPNGIALSPDERTLYVANSGSKFIWMAFDVADDGSTSNGRIFFDATPIHEAGKRGHCDGLAVDSRGNIWATGPGRILIITPNAKHIGTIDTGTSTSNCCFGGVNGNELYITADMNLCRIRVSVKGMGF